MPQVLAYATSSKDGIFEKTTIERREPGPTEIFFEVKYAGICHSDIHTVREEWGPVNYPIVPGHELAGIVTQVGSEVTKFAIGDKVGVGCFVDSCGECEYCQGGQEQFCSSTEKPTVWTYGDKGRDGKQTHGGYSQGITVEQNYACHIPDEIPFEAAAPLMCAGITTYSPLKRWGAGPGKKVAVVGMGGLGHMGVQIAAALGAEVTVISQTMSKQEDGLKFGAQHYFAMNDPETKKKLRASFDLILTTVSNADTVSDLLPMLKTAGALVNVGLPEEPVKVSFGALCGGNKIIAGSNIGGIAETQEMLDFCAEHGLAPQVELISGEEITEAYDKVVASKVRYRYVIDTSTF